MSQFRPRVLCVLNGLTFVKSGYCWAQSKSSTVWFLLQAVTWPGSGILQMAHRCRGPAARTRFCPRKSVSGTEVDEKVREGGRGNSQITKLKQTHAREGMKSNLPGLPQDWESPCSGRGRNSLFWPGSTPTHLKKHVSRAGTPAERAQWQVQKAREI